MAFNQDASFGFSNTHFTGSVTGANVPEPTTLALIGAGLAGLSFIEYKKRAYRGCASICRQ
ncbi:MAG: PEP-CTERM sorting domain-containing protein [Gammaproteobacteria bacterium]|nr:PEP-CTERM sorting domain-containing protein [Gammaproteobacteria bacterium]NIR83634.1 PEP-CTERM sorting domain-containing protein [Gammaproteobacteria bacterium]NIR91607.1 PEP-CTERM sorting domain-containing protein [Gammaproteobacteria bacterium]NIU04796.1 PEP-CTERM sorting domain-containing protein [Gammaproteobacteria bacterium]NIV53146.1 PEP-CTERM sorting domain-containing protein [Gammaproteobacteria bacterium]